MYKPSGRTVLLAAIAAAIAIGLVCTITGIVLIAKLNKLTHTEPTTKWGYSTEGQRIGLETLLLKVQDKYFELYPNKIGFKPGVSADEVKRKYKPFNPKPHLIKQRTDASRILMKELVNLKVSTEKLKQFELRAIAQTKYWVDHVFPYGVPYGYDYYSGDWMLGPDIFCWSPICHSLWELMISLKYFQPVTINDLELVKAKLQEAGQGFLTNVDNIRLGVVAGMVRNVEACGSGWSAFVTGFRFVQVVGKRGILNNTSVKEFLQGDFMSEMKQEAAQQWKKENGKSAKQSLEEFFVEYLGKPVHLMLRYLEFNYTKHCVSSSISSGLSSLPLKYVYVNNNPTVPTTGKLPTGEALNGKQTYYKIMSYFTTTGITADEIYKLGIDLTKSFYDELLQLAREITGESDNEKAKSGIQAKLSELSNFFNTQPVPARESSNEAHSKCISMETAKVHCPVRWQGMVNWFSYVKELTTILRYKVLKLFHFVGPKASVPSCPVEVRAHFNPATAAAVYGDADVNCSTTAKYYIPFFLQNVGPKSDEWTVSAHEMIPGHHLQVQGYLEHFSAEDKGVVKWMSTHIYFLTFAEGWALYAEDPLIARDTDAYKNLPLMKFGALKWQLMRAVRLMVDVGLHSKGMTRDQATKIMSKYLWDDNDRISKELTRYQSVPAQSLTYMIGRLEILKIREKTKKKLGSKFNIKDFHFHLLRQGSSPLSYLDKALDKYTSCELNNKQDGCDEVLSPPIRYDSGSPQYVQEDVQNKDHEMFRPNFLVQ